MFGEGIDESLGKTYIIDGIYGGKGTLKLFLKKQKSTKVMNCIVGPNYLAGIDSNENKFFLIPDLTMHKGFFTESENPNCKRPVSYFFKVFDDCRQDVITLQVRFIDLFVILS